MSTEPKTWGIVLHQPYATLVAIGLKTIETRPRATSHRGRLVNCAAKKINEEAVRQLEPRALSHGISSKHWRALTSITGRALSVHTVLDCRPLRREDESAAWFFAEGRWAWMLGERRVFDVPPKIQGCQGFFPVGPRGVNPDEARDPLEACLDLDVWLDLVRQP